MTSIICWQILKNCLSLHYFICNFQQDATYYYSSSSSIGTTACCGLWPVERCPSIFSYLPPTLSIFSFPALGRSLSTSSFHLFLGLPLLLVPSISWVMIFLGVLSSSILFRWPNQLILCSFIHFTLFSPLLISSSSRLVWLFHSPFSYSGPHILLKIFFSKIATVFSVLYFCRQLYMLRLLTPIIRSSYSCNYSFWHWSTGCTTIRKSGW